MSVPLKNTLVQPLTRQANALRTVVSRKSIDILDDLTASGRQSAMDIQNKGHEIALMPVHHIIDLIV